MSLNFQVSDVQKPLVTVRRITEKGNIVQFGPRNEDSYIMNKATGYRINMVKKGGPTSSQLRCWWRRVFGGRPISEWHVRQWMLRK
jgi:hypothetical protein